MSANDTKTDQPEGNLVSLNDGEIQCWSEKLGVTQNELQVAVEKVGPVVEDVRRFLRK